MTTSLQRLPAAGESPGGREPLRHVLPAQGGEDSAALTRAVAVDGSRRQVGVRVGEEERALEVPQ